MEETNRTLTIVIPALNEEEAIGSTVKRCLDAREQIAAGGRVEDVEILVVSDGSTDRTEEIARNLGVTVLAFEQNRGYGSAIKCGFEYGRGGLVGFMDADGTCDPRFFATLCRAIDEEDADVALGSRMGPESRMPWVRTLGNVLFAWMLGILSKRAVGDTASGMRVLRRSCLPELYPLPDGLHFTPAMSAAILLGGELKLVERPMPYAERLGRSKLSLLRDGVRFFKVIIQAAMCYRPARPLLLCAGALALASFTLGVQPLSFYLVNHQLDEWMIYRVLMSSMLVTGVALLVCAAMVAEQIAATAHDRAPTTSGVSGLISNLFTRPARLAGVGLLGLGSLIVAWPGIAQYASTGQVDMHWSRAVLTALLLVVAAVLSVTTFLLNMMELIRARQTDGAATRPPDRIHRAEVSRV